MQQYLKRAVNSNTRYYYIELLKNLFDDFIVIIEYGSMANKAPTGKKVYLFATLDEAKVKYNNILRLKQNKGYLK